MKICFISMRIHKLTHSDIEMLLYGDFSITFMDCLAVSAACTRRYRLRYNRTLPGRTAALRRQTLFRWRNQCSNTKI